MPVNLNLLPKNLQVSKGLAKVLKTIKALNVIFAVSLGIFTLIITGLYIFNRVSLSNIQTKVEGLKTQVKAQEASEQRLILLKDRLKKIAAVRSTPEASKNFLNIDTLFNNLSSASIVSQASITPVKVSFSMTLGSNEDLSTFIQNLKSTELFKTVEVTTLGYDPLSGYSVDVALTLK